MNQDMTVLVHLTQVTHVFSPNLKVGIKMLPTSIVGALRSPLGPPPGELYPHRTSCCRLNCYKDMLIVLHY